MLGDIVIKYESGIAGPGAISQNPKDPGGTSYGLFQLAANGGLLQKFVNASIFYDRLSAVPLNTREFQAAWQQIAKSFPAEFGIDQRCFALKNLFLPASLLAAYNNFCTAQDCVAEAVFSIAVQHRGYQEIIYGAAGQLDPIAQVRSLYKSRIAYVTSLNLEPSLKDALLKRYAAEESEVLVLAQSA